MFLRILDILFIPVNINKSIRFIGVTKYCGYK